MLISFLPYVMARTFVKTSIKNDKTSIKNHSNQWKNARNVKGTILGVNIYPYPKLDDIVILQSRVEPDH
jgi:hypothetical protein